jgi:uncharacterized phage-associated protein
MKIPVAKLKAMLLFFASKTDPRFLGKVKLMKLFYFVDFEHVRHYGSPVTYDSYVNLEHGPIPSTIMNLVNSVEDDFESSKLGDIISIEEGRGGLKRVISSREFQEKDKDYFTESELKIMLEVSSRFANANKKEIEEASHKETPWSSTDFLDKIPYSLALEDEEERRELETILNIIDS